MGSLARKPFQGVLNIVRFNWQFYVLAGSAAFIIWLLGIFFSRMEAFSQLLLLLILAPIFFSLLISHLVYDRSRLYSLDFLDRLRLREGQKLLNINAGFDETSVAITLKYPYVDLQVLDFYEAGKHTEASIRRARKLYPAYPGTRRVMSTDMKLEPVSADAILLIFAAHEIRDAEERNEFFAQLGQALKKGGHIMVLEHLKDSYNFLAYNIGFMHFYSRKTWLLTFERSGLKIAEEFRHTPFVSGFILEKNEA